MLTLLVTDGYNDDNDDGVGCRLLRCPGGVKNLSGWCHTSNGAKKYFIRLKLLTVNDQNQCALSLSLKWCFDDNNYRCLY